MQNGSGKAKRFAAISLLVLGYGAYDRVRAEFESCTSFNNGRCDQFCEDRGASGSCEVTEDYGQSVCCCSNNACKAF